MILLPHPELEGPALLHVPHLLAPPEGGVETRLELEPLAVVSDLLPDVDQEDVVLAAVLAHVDLPGGLGALATADPCVMLGVGAVVTAPAARGATVGAVAAVGVPSAPRRGRRQAAGGDLDAGRDGGARLLVALGAPIALLAGDAVLTRALAIGLITDLAAGPHWVTVARPAGLLVRHRLLVVPEVSLLAVVAVTVEGATLDPFASAATAAKDMAVWHAALVRPHRAPRLASVSAASVSLL